MSGEQANQDIWRGRTEERISGVERRIDDLDLDIEALSREVVGVRVEIARQGTKIAIGTALAVLVAGPVVAVIAQLIASG